MIEATSIFRTWEQSEGHTRVQFSDGSTACSCGYYRLKRTDTVAGFAKWDTGNVSSHR